MQKTLLTTALILAVLVPAAAEQATYSKPGTITAQAGVGLQWGHYDGIDLAGGAGYSLFQVPFSTAFPVDFGVSGRFSLATWDGLRAGAYVTAQYGFKALNTGYDVIDRLEFTLGVGVSILPKLWPDLYTGLAYHLDRNFSVFEENNWHELILGLAYQF